MESLINSDSTPSSDAPRGPTTHLLSAGLVRGPVVLDRDDGRVYHHPEDNERPDGQGDGEDDGQPARAPQREQQPQRRLPASGPRTCTARLPTARLRHQSRIASSREACHNGG